MAKKKSHVQAYVASKHQSENNVSKRKQRQRVAKEKSGESASSMAKSDVAAIFRHISIQAGSSCDVDASMHR